MQLRPAPHRRRTKSHACISGDSLVYTPSGATSVSAIRPGWTLYSFDDYTLAERTCLAVELKEAGPVHRVTLEDGRSLLSTADQMMVKVVDPKFKLKWAMRWFVWEPLSEFRTGDTVIAAKAEPESIEQKPIAEDDEFAKYIGFRDSSLGEYAVNPFFDATYIELLTIRAIEPVGDVETYEVSVQFDESFVANGFVLL